MAEDDKDWIRFSVSPKWANDEITFNEWKIKKGQPVSHGTMILTYKRCDKIYQFRCGEGYAGIMSMRNEQNTNGFRLTQNQKLIAIEPCGHPVVMKDMCAECGADLRQEGGRPGERIVQSTANVAMIHNIPELHVSQEEAKAQGSVDEMNLIKQRKLELLVDLDQTLIHTTNDHITPGLKDVYDFKLGGPGTPWYHCRLRPHTREFLDAVSAKFQLHICTFGVRSYAHAIARILDPTKSLFGTRILSRDEAFDQNLKSLNLKSLFPCGDHLVCIIDDRLDVWGNATNVISVKPYKYFEHTGDINAPPGFRKETETTTTPPTSTPSSSESADTNVLPAGDRSQIDITDMNNTNNATGDANDENENNDKAAADDADSRTDNNVIIDQTDETTSEAAAVFPTSPNDENGNPEKDAPTNNDANATTKDADWNRDNKETEKDAGTNNDDSAGKDKGNNESEDINNVETSLKTADVSVEVVENDKTIKIDLNVVKNDDKSMAATVDKKDDWVDMDLDEGYLRDLERILNRIHTAYYQIYDGNRSGELLPDVKTVMEYVRKKVLAGIRIVFTGVIETKETLENTEIYKECVRFGAEVTNSLNMSDNEEEQTTHLVAAVWSTTKVNDARRAQRKSNCKIHIVRPDWLWDSLTKWQRQPEQKYTRTKDDQDEDSSSRVLPSLRGYKGGGINRRNRVSSSPGEDTSSSNSKDKEGHDDDGIKGHYDCAPLTRDLLARMANEIDDALSDDEDDNEGDRIDDNQLRQEILDAGKKRKPTPLGEDEHVDEGEPHLKNRRDSTSSSSSSTSSSSSSSSSDDLAAILEEALKDEEENGEGED